MHQSRCQRSRSVTSLRTSLRNFGVSMNYVYYASLVAVGLRSKIVRRRSSSGQPASRRRFKASLGFQAIAGLALLLALIAPGSLLRAQTISAALIGVVHDPRAAVIPRSTATVL